MKDNCDTVNTAAGTLPLQAACDSVGNDSAERDTTGLDTTYYIVLDKEAEAELSPRVKTEQTGVSLLISGLLLIFVVVAIRYRNNSKFISAMLKEITSVRERGNILDNTVRELSFFLILNLLWVVSAGIMLYATITGAPIVTEKVLECVGCSLLYEVGMTTAYWVCGNVFSDGVHSRMWVRGFWAAQSLSTLIMFPIALLLICYPLNDGWAILIGWGAYGISKIMFIWKSFRIFFGQMSAWVLFLYYLCSLEIVPLILTYSLAAAMVEP